MGARPEEAVEGVARAGMSRRQLMRAAAVAGAAAWTAPAILDSVSSAAFATVGSQCVLYYAKLNGAAGCVDHDPSCGFSVPSGTKYVCCSQDSDGEDCPYPDKKPGLATYSTNTNYYKVTLQSGCYYPSMGSWQVVGNYGDPFQCVQLSAGSGAPDGNYSGNGWYTAGGTTAWVKKTHDFGSGAKTFNYVYNLFCCGS